MKIKDKDKKTIYYTDELNDEFSKVQMKPRVIDEKYNYNKNPIWDFCSVIIQNILSMPIKIIDAKLKFRHKFVGKEKLKKHKKDGYFIYSILLFLLLAIIASYTSFLSCSVASLIFKLSSG